MRKFIYSFQIQLYSVYQNVNSVDIKFSHCKFLLKLKLRGWMVPQLSRSKSVKAKKSTIFKPKNSVTAGKVKYKIDY